MSGRPALMTERREEKLWPRRNPRSGKTTQGLAAADYGYGYAAFFCSFYSSGRSVRLSVSVSVSVSMSMSMSVCLCLCLLPIPPKETSELNSNSSQE